MTEERSGDDEVGRSSFRASEVKRIDQFDASHRWMFSHIIKYFSSVNEIRTQTMNLHLQCISFSCVKR